MDVIIYHELLFPTRMCTNMRKILNMLSAVMVKFSVLVKIYTESSHSENEWIMKCQVCTSIAKWSDLVVEDLGFDL